jgi:hypothetical protein
MKSYLRFTRVEFEAIARVCGSARLTDETIPDLQPLLVRSLAERWPDLSARVAGFQKYQVGIIYQHFLERGRAVPCLSPAEFDLVAGACRDLSLGGRFLGEARTLLSYRLRGDSPELAGKVVSMSDEQFEGLCRLVKSQGHPG